MDPADAIGPVRGGREHLVTYSTSACPKSGRTRTSRSSPLAAPRSRPSSNVRPQAPDLRIVGTVPAPERALHGLVDRAAPLSQVVHQNVQLPEKNLQRLSRDESAHGLQTPRQPPLQRLLPFASKPPCVRQGHFVSDRCGGSPRRNQFSAELNRKAVNHPELAVIDRWSTIVDPEIVPPISPKPYTKRLYLSILSSF